MKSDDFGMADENRMGNRGVKPSIFFKKLLDKSNARCYTRIGKREGEQNNV